MITAVDSNVFLDMLIGSAEDEREARIALVAALRQGVIVVSTVIYAELAGRFLERSDLNAFLQGWHCAVEPLDSATAYLAGVYFKEYRQRGGDRVRILPDFLIAAHAELNADRILTRDKRFFGESFPNLSAIRPADLT
jgi:predicted nucleic acid-binding protein